MLSFFILRLREAFRFRTAAGDLIYREDKMFRDILEDCPVIAAVRDEESLERSFQSECSIIFVLYGDVCSIPDITERIKARGKTAMIHLDMIGGLDSREIAVDYIRRFTKADGIISTKTAQIRRAKELGLYTVYRFFLLDSRSVETIRKQCQLIRPDCMELLPGIAPKVIAGITKQQHIPVIAGGLISDREDVMAALQAGAASISTTKQELWFI